jgi:hypothetical protein
MYDAVGPETITMLEMMHVFARLNGRELRPVFVDYRNFERILNEASLGNLNRQFVSLLRSEQDADEPIVGQPAVFESLIGADARCGAARRGALATSGETLCCQPRWQRWGLQEVDACATSHPLLSTPLPRCAPPPARAPYPWYAAHPARA